MWYPQQCVTCLFLHKFCYVMVWKFCGIWIVYGNCLPRWAKLCEILSHSVRYGIYANGRSNFRINTIGSKGVQIFRVITISIAPDKVTFLGSKAQLFKAIVSLTSSLRAISLTIFSGFNKQFSEIFCWKNVSSFCTAKATHIFQQKISEYLRITWCKF